MAILNFRKLDWWLIGTAAALTIIGLLQIYSLNLSGGDFSFFTKQIIFFLIGLLLVFVLTLFDYRFFKNYPLATFLFYLIILIILVAVLFWGRTIKGSTAWFHFGNFIFQPVELAKLAAVLLLAKYFSQRHVEMYRVSHLIISGVYIFIPVGLVLLQPDLGSALILIFLWMGTIILAGIKTRHLLVVLLIGLIVFSSAWVFFLKDYQKHRILTFLNPQKDPLGYSYALNQSIIAIGSGGLWGKGLGRGTQAQLNFLPESKSDFIFAAFAEEWGFFGVCLLFFLWLIIFYRLISTCLESPNNFSRIFVAGTIIVFFSQVTINLGMNLGLMPITGLPLPFVSYGGSSLITSFVFLGIVQSIRVRFYLQREQIGDD